MNITEAEFRKLAEYVKKNYGINLTENKKTLVMGRLHNVLIQNNFSSFSDYYRHVVSYATGDAAITLINKLTTNHTFFLREEQHYKYLSKVVLPYLAVAEKEKKDLRIWSAGCSTGEEPYTIAMVIADYFNTEKYLWDTKILATDISSGVIDRARKGVYTNSQIASLPDKWKRSYFRPYDKKCSVVSEKIKDEVIFRIFNLMNRKLPFKKLFHIIFCRNVMIYFDYETKCELINRFYEMTEQGGYLFIGHSESIIRSETKYKYIMPAVYRKE